MPSKGLAAVSNESIGEEGNRTEDLRPILPRSTDNAWQACEAVRTELSELIEDICRRKNIQALVLQSTPFAHPIWVKFESWIPVDGSVLTARASMTVTLVPMPYHRFETLYSVAWEKHGQTGVYDRLYRFGAAEIERLLDLLCARPEGQLTRFRVHSILGSGRVRTAPLQLWRPRNKVVSVRRDYLKIATWLLVLAGVALMVTDREHIADLVEPPEAAAPASDRAGAEIPSPPATAPTPAPMPQTPPATSPESVVRGALEPSDNRLPDGRFFDQYTYRKQAGEAIRVSMRSTAFDSFLMAGLPSGSGFELLASNDDETATSLDAILLLPAHLSGEIIIRATSALANERGAYTLEVSKP